MHKPELTLEQRSGYRQMHQSLVVGIGTLAVEAIFIITDAPVAWPYQAALIVAGSGLAGSSALHIREANRYIADQTPEQQI